MIKVDGEIINVEHFPDGTQRLKYCPLLHPDSQVCFDWRYESDEELVTLMFLIQHLRNEGFRGDYILIMNFVPNGRMDRIYSNTEVFTLKYFCNIINSLNFSRVFISDPHSNVTPALLNNVIVRDAKFYIDYFLEDFDNDLIIYYPDYSAMKKYSALIPDKKYVYGNKKRNWDNGQILGIEVVNDFNIDLTDKTILMVDDLVSYGGSMHYAAIKLKELGVGKIYAYATHTENSVLDKEKGTLIKSLENGTVEKLFTTNSLYSGKHEKIDVVNI